MIGNSWVRAGWPDGTTWEWRLYLWLSGLAMTIDGLVNLATFGLVHTHLTLRFASWCARQRIAYLKRMRRSI
jgi:hypothetical protein